jgi:hypothetical protein
MANEEENEKKGKRGQFPRKQLEKLDTKHNLKNTAIKSITQIGITVVGGSVGTAVLGKWSFLTGLGLIGFGNYKDVSWMAPLGTGMMASALTLPEEPASTAAFSWAEESKEIKQRLVNMKESFLGKTYLNKIFTQTAASNSNPPTKTTQRMIAQPEEEVSTTENVNGFEEPLAGSEETLDQIEKQLIASAREFQKKQQATPVKPVEGVEPELMGLGELVDFTHM